MASDYYQSDEKAYGRAITGEPNLFLDENFSDAGEFEDRDARELAYLGKKQVLHVLLTLRQFGFWTMLGLSLSVTVTWEGSLVLFSYGLIDGGTAGVIYEYVFTWVGYTCMIASLAELASIAPIAGAQYHWVYMLSPPRWRALFSYIAGWHTVLAWQAQFASGTYFGGTLIQGLLVLNYPDYEFKRWHGTLLMYAMCLPAIIINVLLPKYLSKVEGGVLILHLILFPAILIPVVVLAPHGTPSEVFNAIEKNGGYTSAGVTFLVGMVGSVFSFLGADAACHMSEESKDASRNIPLVMIGTMIINGALGFGMVLAIVFCIGNVTNALNTPTGYPFLEIFTQAVNSVQGATAMTSVIIIVLFFTLVSALAACSRMTWAFARDRGLPGSRWIGHVDERVQVPVWSIAFSISIATLLALINIGSAQAFNAFVSLAISGTLASYIMPVVLLIYQRIVNPGVIKPGRFSLGSLRWPINIIGLCFTALAMVFCFFPVGVPIKTLGEMNWGCVLYGALVVFATIFYLVYGRHNYKGPIVEVDPLGRITEGKA